MQQLLQFFEEALVRPVPDMDEARVRKKGYNSVPIDRSHPLFNEPLVDIADYGIAGQAHYSRPNGATKEPVPGVPTKQLLRKSLADTIAQLNTGLTQPQVVKFFGGKVELYVDDALRPVTLQTQLHDELIPALLRKNHPEMSEDEIAKRREDIIASPSNDLDKPSPHATGAAVDINLRYKQPVSTFVMGAKVDMGHISGMTSSQISPDYFEQHDLDNEQARIGRRNRRAFYAIMTGAAFGIDTGLVNNPTEWWHWSRGDQLAAKVRGDAFAHYSIAEPADT